MTRTGMRRLRISVATMATTAALVRLGIAIMAQLRS